MPQLVPANTQLGNPHKLAQPPSLDGSLRYCKFHVEGQTQSQPQFCVFSLIQVVWETGLQAQNVVPFCYTLTFTEGFSHENQVVTIYHNSSLLVHEITHSVRYTHQDLSCENMQLFHDIPFMIPPKKLAYKMGLARLFSLKRHQ